MISTSKYFLILICLLAFGSLSAQAKDPDPVKDLKPPKNRELFHDFVDKQQKELLNSDGKPDTEFTPSDNEQINFFLTKAAISGVDWVQYRIEKDTLLTSQGKIKYLRGLESLLKYFNGN